MKVNTFNIKVVLEFDTIQPGDMEASKLREIIREGMKDSVPKGARISDVIVKCLKTEDKPVKEVIDGILEESNVLKKAEAELLATQYKAPKVKE